MKVWNRRTKAWGLRTVRSGQRRSQCPLAWEDVDQTQALDRDGHSLHLLQHHLVVPGHQAQPLLHLPDPLPDEHHHALRLGHRRSDFGGRWSCGLSGHDLGPKDSSFNRERFLTHGSVLRYGMWQPNLNFFSPLSPKIMNNLNWFLNYFYLFLFLPFSFLNRHLRFGRLLQFIKYNILIPFFQVWFLRHLQFFSWKSKSSGIRLASAASEHSLDSSLVINFAISNLNNFRNLFFIFYYFITPSICFTGLEVIDPILSNPVKKLAFVSIWFSFCVALFLLNRSIEILS